MLFSSLEFIFFFAPVVVCVYLLAGGGYSLSCGC